MDYDDIVEEAIPTRCFTCTKPLSIHLWDLKELLTSGFTMGAAMTELNILRPCCRARMMTPIKVHQNLEDRAKIEGLVDASVSSSETKRINQNLAATLAEKERERENKKRLEAVDGELLHLREIPDDIAAQYERLNEQTAMAMEQYVPERVPLGTAQPFLPIIGEQRDNRLVSIGLNKFVPVVKQRTYLSR